MKKLMFLLLAVLLFEAAIGQQESSYKKSPSLGFSFFLNDMYTAERISKKTLSTVLDKKQWAKTSEMTPGLSIQYLDGLSENVDFAANLAGTFTKYPFYPKSGLTVTKSNKFLIEGDVNLHLKLLSDKYRIVPYTILGVGASMYSGTYFAAQANTGLGIQLGLGNETFFNSQVLFKPAVSNNAVNHMGYTFGIISPLKERSVPIIAPPLPPPPPPVVEKDTDGDGILDKNDKCPEVAGTAKYDGCPVPDTDGDGINDENDKCISVKGLARYKGCPIPDTDKDGINDEEDKCPNTAGLARYQGCSIPDTDGDGINDEEDKCPNEEGIASLNGCPEPVVTYDFASKTIYFASGSAQLSKKALKTLNQFIKDLVANKELKIQIIGHTDNSGSAKINKPLSLKRANNVKAYLIKNKIKAERISTINALSSDEPTSDNSTKEGRAKNRRVELKSTQ